MTAVSGKRDTRLPLVSFVVPCYNLAHLLPQCVQSILGQTYQRIEVLIMDDCSPDDTAAVAGGFGDERVRYIRNERNLGHLRNYNKGISLARGECVWLISADDYLRVPHVVQRYVDVLAANTHVGYVFCDGVGVLDGKEQELLTSAINGRRDWTVSGHAFLPTLLRSNCVLAASGLVRRECYQRLGMFPLDMPWAGDWYLWSLFAFYYDVAYLAEPMVCYRVHDLSMTTKLTREKLNACAEEEIRIPWMIRDLANTVHAEGLSKRALEGVANTYIRIIGSRLYKESGFHMNLEAFERSVGAHTADERERDWVRSRVYAGIANECYWRDEYDAAETLYAMAISKAPLLMQARLKKSLLSLGPVGRAIRRGLKGRG